MIESAEEPLAYIFNTFKEGSKVDLRAIKNYFDANKGLRDECKIFIRKLELYLASKNAAVLAKEDFYRYFNQSVSEPAHFNVVFDSIDSDGSGCISKNELRQLFRRYNVPCTEEDVAMMIEVCSQDGQKIRKKDLEQFLRA